MRHGQTGHERRAKKSYIGIFTATLEGYLESTLLIDLGNIPASNPDPEAKRPLSLLYRAQYCADIEKAVRAVLNTKQKEDCFDAMLCEIAGRPLQPEFSLGLRADVVRAVGREFEFRRLAPWQYYGRRAR
jgi:hypothetical protein